MEPASVQEARQNLPHVVGLARIGREHPVDLLRRVGGILGLRELEIHALHAVQVLDDVPHDVERFLFVRRHVVGHAAHARVDLRSAEILRRDLFSGRGLHERGPAEIDGPGAFHDHVLVGHRRDVRAPGGAHAEHGGDLGDSLGGHDRLVVEDPSEMLPVRKHLRLEREEHAPRVDQIDRREPVLERDLLSPDVLPDGDRVVGTPLHRGVVGDDHAFLAGNGSDPGHDARRGDLVLVETGAGERRELQEGRVGIEQPFDPLPHEELPSLALELDRLGGAPLPDLVEAAAKVRGQRLVMGSVSLEFGRPGLEVASQNIHGIRTL